MLGHLNSLLKDHWFLTIPQQLIRNTHLDGHIVKAIRANYFVVVPPYGQQDQSCGDFTDLKSELWLLVGGSLVKFKFKHCFEHVRSDLEVLITCY